MSFRSAVRIARPALARVAPRAPAQAVARRSASSKSGGSSGNTTWAMGSAAVFGPLLAYIMFSGPGNDAAHAIHENIDAKASGQRAYVPASPGVPGAESGKKPSDLDAHATPNQDSNPRSTSGDDDSASGPKDQTKASAGAADSEDSDADKSEESSSGSVPSAKEVRDSVKQAMSANAPLPAMDSEEKQETPLTTGTSAKTKSSGSESSSDSSKSDESASGGDDGDFKPSQEDIKNSLNQAEKVAVPRAAMDDEVKHSAAKQ